MDRTNSNIAKFVFLILINSLINLEYVSAQNIERDLKNTAYISYGNIISSSQISISYERLIFDINKMQTRVKANYGTYLSNNADFETNAKVYEHFSSISAVQLIGILELNAGLAYTQYKLAKGLEPEQDMDYSKINQRIEFYGNIGIRYAKNNFLIRTGLGNLELLYFGIGVNF